LVRRTCVILILRKTLDAGILPAWTFDGTSKTGTKTVIFEEKYPVQKKRFSMLDGFADTLQKNKEASKSLINRGNMPDSG